MPTIHKIELRDENTSVGISVAMGDVLMTFVTPHQTQIALQLPPATAALLLQKLLRSDLEVTPSELRKIHATIVARLEEEKHGRTD